MEMDPKHGWDQTQGKLQEQAEEPECEPQAAGLQHSQCESLYHTALPILACILFVIILYRNRLTLSKSGTSKKYSGYSYDIPTLFTEIKQDC